MSGTKDANALINMNVLIEQADWRLLDSLETQQKITPKLEQDPISVAGATRLQAKMGTTIRTIIARVWGEP